MKNRIKILIAGFLLFSCFAVQAGERKKEKDNQEAFEKVVKLVESNFFYIEATDAFPSGNSSITIKTTYGSRTLGGEGHISLASNRGEIIMMDSVAVGRLPFFGRGYNLPYGGDGGIEFDKDAVKDRTIKVVNKRKKQYVEYKFSVQAKNDVFNIYMEVYANGKCSIHVTSNNRASISYAGILSPIPAEKAQIYMK